MEFQILVSRDLDGRLDAADDARLRAHLASCEACRAHQASMQAVSMAFRDLRGAEVRAGFADQVIDRARNPLPRPFRIARPTLVPIAAGVLAMCMISGALGWRLREPGDVRAAAAPDRQSEAEFSAFLADKLGLEPDKVEAVLGVRRDFDRRRKAEEADLQARREKLDREEIEAIWTLLPSDARARYRAGDPTFVPPEASPR